MKYFLYLCARFVIDNYMKKIFSLLAVMCVAIEMIAATTFTFTSSGDINQTKDGITVVLAKGSGQNAPLFTQDYETKQPEMRLYLNNTITISSETNLTNIQLVCAKSSASNKEYAGLSASVGNLVSGGVATDKNDWKVDQWTGSATQVVFTLTGGKQRRIQRIVIDGDPIEITPVEVVLPTEDDLEAEYTYTEPTTVHVPDTQFFKNEYAFVDNNILVHCSQGSIIKATDSTEAYFNCNADNQLRFTATQAIKGIAITGYVRKAFSATCDKGTIEYLSDADSDIDNERVLIIRDIHDKSVTITCDKQIRCYEVKVYFNDNPALTDDEQGIESVETPAKAEKFIREGILYIRKGEKTYTL